MFGLNEPGDDPRRMVVAAMRALQELSLIDSGDRIKQFNNMFTVGLIFVLPPKIKTTN